MIELVECVDARGISSYGRWRAKLDPSVNARIILATLRLASGNFSSTKVVGGGVSELRIDFGPGYRVYFGRDGASLVLLLGGGTKKRQQNDIEAARELWRQYKQAKPRGI
jgi:putative addiction module killer protein